MYTYKIEKFDEISMIRYNHPGDINVWFVQRKQDDVPQWAVNIEDYHHSDEE